MTREGVKQQILCCVDLLAFLMAFLHSSHERDHCLFLFDSQAKWIVQTYSGIVTIFRSGISRVQAVPNDCAPSSRSLVTMHLLPAGGTLFSKGMTAAGLVNHDHHLRHWHSVTWPRRSKAPTWRWMWSLSFSGGSAHACGAFEKRW